MRLQRLRAMLGARARARGFSLVEALVASAVLILGLTGITLMLTRGVTNARNGQQAMESSQLVTRVLSDFQAAGFDNLVLSTVGATFDAGNADDAGYFSDASGRVYSAAYIVSDITTGSPPALVVTPTYQIDVEVAYRDGTGIMVFKRGGTIISRAPDAGP